jgi:hypothetical protein
MKLKIEVPCTGNNGKVKAMAPPGPTPEVKALTRVLLISAIDGWSVVALSALGTLLALAVGEYIVALAGLLIMAAGLLELHGRRRLQLREASGMRLLVWAQLFLLGAIWTYAWYRWRFFDADALWRSLPELAQVRLDTQLAIAGLDPAADRAAVLEMMNFHICVLLAFLTLLFQGGLVLYYRSRTPRVAAALAAPPQSPLA